MITPWYIGYLINQFGANNIEVTNINHLTEMLAGNDAYDEINKSTKRRSRTLSDNSGSKSHTTP